MLIQKAFIAILIHIFLFGQIFAQVTLIKKEVPPEVKQKAVALLRETIKELSHIKSDTRRRAVFLEAALLLWNYDQKEARSIFEAEMNAISRELTGLETEGRETDARIEDMKKAIISAANASNQSANIYVGVHSGNKVIAPGVYDELKKGREKYAPTMILRRNLIQKLIKTAPLIAYCFMVDTEKLIPEFAGGYFDELRYKTGVVEALALKDIDAAVTIAREMGTEALQSGSYVSALNIIYAINAEKGALLAEEILQKISAIRAVEEKIELLDELFRSAANKTKTGQKPLLSETAMQRLANILADAVLASDTTGTKYYSELLEKYVPEKAAGIRQKAQTRKDSNSSVADFGANTANVAATNITVVNKPVRNPVQKKKIVQEADKAAAERQQAQADWRRKIMEQSLLLQKLQSGKLTARERARLLKQIEGLVSERILNSDMRNYGLFSGFGESTTAQERKLTKLTFFAGLSNDRKLAEKLMTEAASLARPQIKKPDDYFSNMWLVSGYSAFQPEKSFVILENTLSSLNDLLSEKLRMTTYLYHYGDIPVNDELLLSYIFNASLDENLNGANNLFGNGAFLINLAKADFARMAALMNKLNHSELRIAAKLMFLNALLGEWGEIKFYYS